MDSDPNSTIRLKPHRIFHCDMENRKMDRTGVWKDYLYQYRCGSCGMVVRDVTLTETAKSLQYWWWGVIYT